MMIKRKEGLAMSLCAKFLEDKGLTESSKELKGVIGACLYAIVIEPRNNMLDKLGLTKEDAAKGVYTEDVFEDTPYVMLLDLTISWFNDLLWVLDEYLKKEGHTGKLWDEGAKPDSKVFFDWFNARYGI